MKNILIAFFLFTFFNVFSSEKLPYKWEIESNIILNNQLEIILTCEIEDEWHIYSINNPEGGSIATTFSFENNEFIKFVQPWLEPQPTIVYEEVFEVDQWYHSGTVQFKSVIEIGDDFPDKNLQLTIQSMACMSDGVCTPPENFEFKIELPENEKREKTGYLWVFWIGFGAGFLALLTPCVFPMVPMTVTYFTKQKEKGIQKAIIYGLFIIVIYVSLGLGLTLLFGPETLYNMSSSASFNIIFFIIFVVFALSFLGAFDIVLPQSWVNKMDQKSDSKGIMGLFFMAFTLTLVSFSCTGPIMGSLLVKTAIGGELLLPFMGMLGFGVALALPFTLFAFFPTWLNKLPKSGSWLNTVKVVLGFLELALAFKFLSNADLVLQAGWLKREVFIVIWVVIFAFTSLYLLGIFRMSHDSKVETLSVTRLLFSLIFMMFSLYLATGLWGAKLKLLSGVLPPETYSENQFHGNSNSFNFDDNSKEKKCPNRLACFFDYEEGLEYAKLVNKPILLDFTGFSCANCRRMEENVWTVPEIDAIIRNEYVLISLYVDDEYNQLPENKQYTSKVSGKKITTYGAKWKDLQIERFQELSQPLYVLLHHDETILQTPIAYETNPEMYKEFLQKGLKRFESLSGIKID
jgi:cytochrome c biogenesis protein CcdA/thioredoxin-related protein